MTKHLSADEKIALTYVRLAATAITECMDRLPKTIDFDASAGRLAAHLDGLYRIECWMSGDDAPWKPTPSEERRVAIMARSFADAIEATHAASLTRLAAGLKRLTADAKRLDEVARVA